MAHHFYDRLQLYVPDLGMYIYAFHQPGKWLRICICVSIYQADAYAA